MQDFFFNESGQSSLDPTLIPFSQPFPKHHRDFIQVKIGMSAERASVVPLYCFPNKKWPLGGFVLYHGGGGRGLLVKVK